MLRKERPRHVLRQPVADYLHQERSHASTTEAEGTNTRAANDGTGGTDGKQYG